MFVVQATGAQLDRWFELAKPDSGVALILIGDVRSSRLGSRFVVDERGVGEFHGLDTKVRVFGLEGATAAAIEDVFRPRHADGVDEPGAAEEPPGQAGPSGPAEPRGSSEPLGSSEQPGASGSVDSLEPSGG